METDRVHTFPIKGKHFSRPHCLNYTSFQGYQLKAENPANSVQTIANAFYLARTAYRRETIATGKTLWYL
ncbi:MAG: hypothetical protein ACO3NK_12955 [Prochlorotrichaceae cyanobacterium]